MIEILGMVGTRDASEIRGPLVDGPVVDWTDGPVVDPAYLAAIARAHDEGGFDKVLVGHGAVAPEGWAVASAVLASTRRLGVLVAHRPGLVHPTVLARQAATADQLSGGGRVAVHFITGGDEADQRREGDFAGHDDRYGRTGEVMRLVRRLWEADGPIDHEGAWYRCEGGFTSVKPTPAGIPMWFAGASPAALAAGAGVADVYAFWGEPRAAIAERIATVRAAAAAAGRTPSFSVSLRPILADTEAEAWDRARWIASLAEERIALARRRAEAGGGTGLGSAANRTYAVERSTSVTTSEGRRRLIEMSRTEVADERLWMRIAELTGAAGNSTALVGTPEQVAESMLRYHDLGVDRFILKGFEPVEDALDYGRRLLPLVRREAEDRPAAHAAM